MSGFIKLCAVVGFVVISGTFILGSYALYFFVASKAQNFSSWHSPAKPETPPLLLMADAAADKHGLDNHLFRALVAQESGWNKDAKSKKGASGLTQLMPATAKEECGLTSQDIFDPAKNLDCGAFYFAKQMRRFGSVDLALAAYNSGPDRVAKLGRVPRIPETQDYVERIKTSWESARK